MTSHLQTNTNLIYHNTLNAPVFGSCDFRCSKYGNNGLYFFPSKLLPFILSSTVYSSGVLNNDTSLSSSIMYILSVALSSVEENQDRWLMEGQRERWLDTDRGRRMDTQRDKPTDGHYGGWDTNITLTFDLYIIKIRMYT